MLRIYLPSSTDLKLCSDVPTVDFVNKWTFVTIFTSRYLGSNIWVLTIVGWKCEDESAKMKVRGWKCKEESARMKVRGWKCGNESARMKMLGWKMLGMKASKDEKSEDEKTEDETARMKLQGWSVTQPSIYVDCTVADKIHIWFVHVLCPKLVKNSQVLFCTWVV